MAVASTSAVKDNPSDSNDKLNLDENLIEEEKIVDKEILKNGDAACNTDNIDVDIEDDMKAYHNSATIRYRKKTGSNNTDLDSIEHLDSEDDETKKNDGNLEDDIDSVSAEIISHYNNYNSLFKLNYILGISSTNAFGKCFSASSQKK